jgi:hypothetical protein
VNGEEVTLDQSATLLNGRTVVPARFIAENLGAIVGWDDLTRTVTITSDNNSDSVSEFYPGTFIPSYESVVGTPVDRIEGEIYYYWCCLSHFNQYVASFNVYALFLTYRSNDDTHRTYKIGDALIDMIFTGTTGLGFGAGIAIEITRLPDPYTYEPAVFYHGTNVPTFGAFTGISLYEGLSNQKDNSYQYYGCDLLHFEAYHKLLILEGFEETRSSGDDMWRTYEKNAVIVDVFYGSRIVIIDISWRYGRPGAVREYYPGTPIPTFGSVFGIRPGQSMEGIWSGIQYWYSDVPQRDYFWFYLNALEDEGFTQRDLFTLSGRMAVYAKDGFTVTIQCAMPFTTIRISLPDPDYVEPEPESKPEREPDYIEPLDPEPDNDEPIRQPDSGGTTPQFPQFR